jgi:glycosyltransferase involved in cell wall biosynthesis
MQKAVVDIICFGKNTQGLNWLSGHKHVIEYTVDAIEQVLQKNIIHEEDNKWLFFWNTNLGQPDEDLVSQLVRGKTDVWHCGLKSGLAGKPQTINYIEPLWLYNTDAPIEQEHSSFRMSMQVALIKCSVLNNLQGINTSYSSPAILGLDIGYQVLKSGAVIRYTPRLIQDNIEHEEISLRDEWIFTRRYFPLKWQLWTLLNKPSFSRNLKSWWQTRAVNRLFVAPVLHSSTKSKKFVADASVSVLAPTLDRYEYLSNELSQLSEQTIMPLEVLMTDQTDKERRKLITTDEYPRLNLRYFPQDEKGQCVAWNKLLEEAKGEFILFLGDDADDIIPGFIEKLLATQALFDCDIVASNVIENGLGYSKLNEHFYMSDTLPIALVRKSLLDKTGYFNMFFNKNIRADHELAIRCHLKGALMIFDSSATIFHHRAPIGGLRAHNARRHTTASVKRSLSKFLNPTSSELYIAHKYYSATVVKSYVRIKYLNQLFIKGHVLKKSLRVLLFILKAPSLYKQYRINKAQALEELNREKYFNSHIKSNVLHS